MIAPITPNSKTKRATIAANLCSGTSHSHKLYTLCPRGAVQQLSKPHKNLAPSTVQADELFD